MEFKVGQTVRFAGIDSVIEAATERQGRAGYDITNGADHLPMWVPKDILEKHQHQQGPLTTFNTHLPGLIVVDDFFRDPDEIRDIALHQEYWNNPDFFKGLRSKVRFLWPYLREEFGRLIGRTVTEWMGHNANGVFQLTNANDQLVWHFDSQQYAAAIYLTPDAPPTTGTSFWRDRTYGCRRSPHHPFESQRLGPEGVQHASEEIFSNPYHFTHIDNWELIESIAGLYNRLVIWDAQLVHSATSYVFPEERAGENRLVQLFFFDAS